MSSIDRATRPPPKPLAVAISGSRGYPSTYGGFETLVRRLAPFLVSRGHSVTVYGRTRAAGTQRVGVVNGVRVVHPPGIDTKSASTLTFGLAAAVHMARYPPDAALVLNIANGFALPILKARRIPTVVNIDGVEWERAKWGHVARSTFLAGAHLSAANADLLIADSVHLGQLWSDRFGVEASFIPYGADVVEDAGVDRVVKLGLKPRSYILAVARLAPENNIELVIEAVERLSWSVPLVIVGSANYKNPLSETLASHDRLGHLKWLGHVSDQELLTELWANAGVYFHGHSVGGTNPALLQALGCGAPTLAVRTPYNWEVLGLEEQLVDARSEAIAHEICRLLDDADRQRALAERGRHIVAERYQWNDVCHSYEEAFLNVGAGRPSRQARRWTLSRTS